MRTATHPITLGFETLSGTRASIPKPFAASTVGFEEIEIKDFMKRMNKIYILTFRSYPNNSLLISEP
jgi:hypothetical protein